MALKFLLSAEEVQALREELQGEYRPTDKEKDKEVFGEDVFILDTDGVPESQVKGLKSALTKERMLVKKLEKESKENKGIPIEEYEDLKTKYEDLEIQLQSKDGTDEEAIKQRIEKAVEARVSKHEREVQTKNDEISRLTSQVSELTEKHRSDLLHQLVERSIPETVHRSALEDIYLFAQRELQFEETANDGKGGFIHSETGMEISDWLDSKLAEKTHWLKQSEGAGVPGGGGVKTKPDGAQLYKKAKEDGDVQAMLSNLPPINESKK